MRGEQAAKCSASSGMSSGAARAAAAAEREDVQAVEEVLAEAPLRTPRREVAVGRGDDADVDLDGLRAAAALDSCSSSTRSSLACSSSGSSPISSRKRVPPSASLEAPLRLRIAPVKAPRSWPNSSLSISVGGSAAQLTHHHGAARAGGAWIARATSSLPVPVSRGSPPSNRWGPPSLCS